MILPTRNALHYRQALEAASVDPLTGLKNRRSYVDNLVVGLYLSPPENAVVFCVEKKVRFKR